MSLYFGLTVLKVKVLDPFDSGTSYIRVPKWTGTLSPYGSPFFPFFLVVLDCSCHLLRVWEISENAARPFQLEHRRNLHHVIQGRQLHEVVFFLQKDTFLFC